MTFFGKNIKKIRTIQKLNQSNFGEIFGLSRASIGAYEEGRAEAKLDVIIKIANYFSITVDHLVNKDITVNELSHFNIFDQNFNKNISLGNEVLKKIAFVNIPAISSHDLLINDLAGFKEASSQEIKLPFVTEKHFAIIIEQNNFQYIAKRISSNDVVIVLEDENLWKEAEPENKYWLIKAENTLYLGEVKITKTDTVLFFPEDSNPLSIPLKTIDFILPVDTLIENKPKVDSSESERLKQMELKINDLYNRL